MDSSILVLLGITFFAAFVNGALGYGFSTLMDTCIVISNDHLLKSGDKKPAILEAFKSADEIVRLIIKGISDIIMVSGYINVDFADIKALLSKQGRAIMSVGKARGEMRSFIAATRAVSNTLLKDRYSSIKHATRVLISKIGRAHV